MVVSSVGDYFNQAIYGALGLVICVVNGLLICSIVMEKTLRNRKEMLIIAGLGTADFLFGLSALLMGSYRLVVMAFGWQSVTALPWNCMSQSPMLLTYTGNQLTVLMNILVSADRYMAVAYPMKYRAMTTSYAKKILFCVLLYGIIFSVIVLLSVSSLFCTNPGNLTRLCTASGIPAWLSHYYSTTVPFGGCLAVIIYIAVFYVGKRKLSQVRSADDGFESIQKRLTVTVGIITFSTFLLYVVPSLVQFFCSWFKVPNTYSTLWASFTRISTIVNVAIYVNRQKEIRAGMKKLIACRNHSNSTAAELFLTTSHGVNSNIQS